MIHWSYRINQSRIVFFFLMYKHSWIIQLLLKIKFLRLTSKNIFSNFTFKNIIKWLNYSEFFHLFIKIVFIIIKLSKSKLAKNFIFYVFGRCTAAMTEQFFNGEFVFFFTPFFPFKFILTIHNFSCFSAHKKNNTNPKRITVHV